MSRVTPEHLARVRIISAAAVLENQVDLRTYPHRHLAVVAQPGLLGNNTTLLLAAADHLAQLGWELVNVVQLTGGLHAFMRRR